MREILFRGKRTDTGEWVEGFYVELFDHKGRRSHRIYPGYAETDCGDFYPDFCEVLPETVGQFTGLIDHRGKRVFQGDVFRLKYRFTAVNPMREKEWFPEDETSIILAYVEFSHGEFCLCETRRAIYIPPFNRFLAGGKGLAGKVCVSNVYPVIERQERIPSDSWTIFQITGGVISNIHDNPELIEESKNKK